MVEKYDFKESEKKILDLWKKEEIFKFNEESDKELFSIDIPPPTISGKMHIGHAFQYSHLDFIARFKRMNGFNVFYPFGTDDNGLPTEKLVEKMNNVSSKKMSREEFVKLCNETLKEITPDFIQDWKNTGVSSDYEKYYSTIDLNSQKLSQKSFLDLFSKKEIFREEFPTLWCCECQTAIAQAELEDKEKTSLFSTLKFKSEGKILPIATTRPELLGACVAVFVNPNDSRYKNLIGKKANVPLFNFEVPIIADESAQIDKGTGVLMVCSYGDKYDVQAIIKHRLNPKIILDEKGILKIKEYEGLRINQARKKTLEDLKEADLIIEQKQINHVANVHERCGTEIEFLPTSQWFLKVLDKKEKLLEQGKKINWHPEFMRVRYENWVNGLEWDWNISRDRHFGIPIPIWECESCNKIIVPEESELPVDPTRTEKKCACGKIAKPETKVFDTWKTSSITPQIILSLMKGNKKVPCSLRCNAHDIIRTWDFYTIVKSLLHENEIPWKDLMVSGFVTLKGEKMSKSKGNVIDPRKIIDEFGADPLRFWAASSKLGTDLDFQDKEILNGKKLITKIWNATSFVFNGIDESYIPPKEIPQLEEIDKLFLIELNKLIESSKKNFSEYEYSKVKSDAENFFWNTYCNNYLEIVKYRIYNGTEQEKESAVYGLYTGLLTLMKIFAPIIPFITEEVYQKYFRKREKSTSIHQTNWPEKIPLTESEENVWEKFTEILEAVRKEKSIAQKSMKAEIILTITSEEKKILSKTLDDLIAVCSIKELKEGEFRVEFI